MSGFAFIMFTRRRIPQACASSVCMRPHIYDYCCPLAADVRRQPRPFLLTTTFISTRHMPPSPNAGRQCDLRFTLDGEQCVDDVSISSRSRGRILPRRAHGPMEQQQQPTSTPVCTKACSQVPGCYASFPLWSRPTANWASYSWAPSRNSQAKQPTEGRSCYAVAVRHQATS
jgi:hypothetical protein